MDSYTVLICDDSASIHSSLSSYFRHEGFNVISVYDGESALEQVKKTKIDIVLLDIMLPGMNGFDVCRNIRKTSDVYIIILSAKDEEIDRVLGLELGADDYVTKPFSPRELVYRMKRAMRRIHHTPKDLRKLTMGELTVYPESYRVLLNGSEISMSTKEVDVLAYMMSNPGRVLTREHLLNAAWNYGYYGDPRVVDGLIKTLRQKLAGENLHFAIQTVYGVGYKIEERP